MYFSDDPVADYDRHCAEQERKLAKYPKCDNCGEYITDEYFYNIDGTFICEDCMKIDFRKNTEDFIEEE